MVQRCSSALNGELQNRPKLLYLKAHLFVHVNYGALKFTRRLSGDFSATELPLCRLRIYEYAGSFSFRCCLSLERTLALLARERTYCHTEYSPADLRFTDHTNRSGDHCVLSAVCAQNVAAVAPSSALSQI